MEQVRLKKILNLRQRKERIEAVELKIQNLLKEKENLLQLLAKEQEFFNNSPLTSEEEEFLSNLS